MVCYAGYFDSYRRFGKTNRLSAKGNDMLSQNVGTELHCAQRNIPEEKDLYGLRVLGYNMYD
jgi:hypothetical protein